MHFAAFRAALRDRARLALFRVVLAVTDPRIERRSDRLNRVDHPIGCLVRGAVAVLPESLDWLGADEPVLDRLGHQRADTLAGHARPAPAPRIDRCDTLAFLRSWAPVVGDLGLREHDFAVWLGLAAGLLGSDFGCNRHGRDQLIAGELRIEDCLCESTCVGLSCGEISPQGDDLPGLLRNDLLQLGDAIGARSRSLYVVKGLVWRRGDLLGAVFAQDDDGRRRLIPVRPGRDGAIEGSGDRWIAVTLAAPLLLALGDPEECRGAIETIQLRRVTGTTGAKTIEQPEIRLAAARVVARVAIIEEPATLGHLPRALDDRLIVGTDFRS